MFSVEPLINPYLWALGEAASTIAPGQEVAGRYRVIAPQVWLDTQPDHPLEPSDELHRELLPYLFLYPHKLHIPVVYDQCSTPQGTVVLLENAPLEGAGSLQPSLQDSLTTATPLRQMNWFWQILRLWEPLSQCGVGASLLVTDNLRVEGWRIRLRELYAALGKDAPLGAGLDVDRYSIGEIPQPALHHLGQTWSSLANETHSSIRGSLLAIGEKLQSPDADYPELLAQTNQLLLEQSAQSPLRIQIAAATDRGPQRDHNEDTSYPLPQDLLKRGIAPDSQLIPHLSIVCDGLGGHEGGEVASQIAVRTLKLQMQALLSETLTLTQPLSPDLVMQQIAASIRVVNNLIDAQNNDQAREARKRMGTTLVMALHLQQPQGGPVGTSLDNPAHEVYIASVGDSRAYWITNRYCQCLTVDDDVACREVRMGRSTYRTALQRLDAGSLTQALGTRDGDQLYVNLQRLILDEDGVLLLCSDGLSDHGLVEQAWAESIGPILAATNPLEEDAQHWVGVANSRNGHDNVSVVLSRCRVTPDYPVLLGTEAIEPLPTPAESLTVASEALLANLDASPETVVEVIAAEPKRGAGCWLKGLGFLALLAAAASVGYIGVQQLNPGGVRFPSWPTEPSPAETLTPLPSPASTVISPTGVSPTGVSPTGVSPTGASPTSVSPTGVSPTPGTVEPNGETFTGPPTIAPEATSATPAATP
jgi:protein phosphatase